MIDEEWGGGKVNLEEPQMMSAARPRLQNGGERVKEGWGEGGGDVAKGRFMERGN